MSGQQLKTICYRANILRTKTKKTVPKQIKKIGSMSQVIFEDPVKRITGKVEPQSNMSFRRNGEKVFTYTLQHPRTEKDFSEHEKKYRQSFGEASKEASRLCHDTRYAERWNDYQEHGYLSRHKYVLHLIVNGEIESA